MLGRLLSLSPRRLLAMGLVVGGALLGILLIVLWQLGLFDSAPPPASLESAVGSVLQESETADRTDEEGELGEPSSDVTDESADDDSGDGADQSVSVTRSGANPSLADLVGGWTLSSRGTSYVGYRILEELVNIGTTTAVGRTSDIEAELQFDGEAITSVRIVADLRTLESDERFRDSRLRTQGIETNTYPFATFELTEPIPIAALPTGEETLAVEVQGTLDLHGVTNAVSIMLEGQYVDGLVVVVGSTEIVLADYEIEKPSALSVLSIEDEGIMEFELVLEQSP